MIDQQTAIKMACRFILWRIQSYQIMPTKPDGSIDWDTYIPGETRWNMQRYMDIRHMECDKVGAESGDYYQVTLMGVWAWSEDDYEETSFHFDVLVPVNTNPDTDNDFECDRYL